MSPTLAFGRLRRALDRRRIQMSDLRVQCAAERLACQGGDPLALRVRDEEPPHVCPGCFAVNAPCEPGCIDAEMARDREDDRDRCGVCGAAECDSDECADAYDEAAESRFIRGAL